MNLYLCIVLIVACSAASAYVTYKKGLRKGAKFREDEILNEYCVYIPVGEISELAKDLMEQDGYSENFPIMLIMPDKYDYIEGEVNN